MEFIFDVNENNFQAQVIEASFQKPVFVDFWAEWCAPCRALKPVLEKVFQSFEGKALLAKLNTEDNPGVAQRFQIRGIPNVKIFQNGKVVDEFTGLVPEGEIIAKIKKYIPDELDVFLRSSVESNLSLEAFENVYSKFQKEDRFLIHYGKALLSSGKLDKGLEILNQIHEVSEFYLEAKGLISLNSFIQYAGKKPVDKYEELYVKAAVAYLGKKLPEALEHLSQLLFRKKDYLEGQAKNTMIALLSQCQDEETRDSYGRRLSMAINS